MTEPHTHGGTDAPECTTCRLPVATVEEAITGRARYGDTQGGHNDRHTLVIEAAERATRRETEPETDQPEES